MAHGTDDTVVTWEGECTLYIGIRAIRICYSYVQVPQPTVIHVRSGNEKENAVEQSRKSWLKESGLITTINGK